MTKIVLLGYMGSGKSTIAQSLSEKTKIKVVDLDKIIENRTNLSIKTIFDTKGELYFRKLEHEIFKELMASDEKLIISLGGGTPCYANNHEMLKGENVASFYLKGSIETLYRRLISTKENRPLIAEQSEDDMKEYIAKHLFDRSFYYNQAMHKISIDDKSVEEVVNDIVDKLA